MRKTDPHTKYWMQYWEILDRHFAAPDDPQVTSEIVSQLDELATRVETNAIEERDHDAKASLGCCLHTFWRLSADLCVVLRRIDEAILKYRRALASERNCGDNQFEETEIEFIKALCIRGHYEEALQLLNRMERHENNDTSSAARLLVIVCNHEPLRLGAKTEVLRHYLERLSRELLR